MDRKRMETLRRYTNDPVYNRLVDCLADLMHAGDLTEEAARAAVEFAGEKARVRTRLRGADPELAAEFEGHMSDIDDHRHVRLVADGDRVIGVGPTETTSSLRAVPLRTLGDHVLQLGLEDGRG